MRIPPPPLLGVAQPECAREIEHALPARDECGGDLRRHLVGQREEHGVGRRGERIQVERIDRGIPQPRQRRHPAAGGAR